MRVKDMNAEEYSKFRRDIAPDMKRIQAVVKDVGDIEYTQLLNTPTKEQVLDAIRRVEESNE